MHNHFAIQEVSGYPFATNSPLVSNAIEPGGKAGGQDNFSMILNGEMLTVCITCNEGRPKEATVHFSGLINETKRTITNSFTNVPQLHS